jgi:hypothetical protein
MLSWVENNVSEKERFHSIQKLMKFIRLPLLSKDDLKSIYEKGFIDNDFYLDLLGYFLTSNKFGYDEEYFQYRASFVESFFIFLFF